MSGSFKAAVLLAGLTGVMWCLHLTLLFGATCTADDAMYVSRAISGVPREAVANRYVHIHGLRMLFLVTGSGPWAAALHGLSMTTVLSLLAFAIAARAKGRTAGLVAAALTWAYMMVASSPTVAYPDITMTAYAGLALWFVMRAVRDRDRAWWPLLLAGFFLLLALKSKETSVAVIPAILVALRGVPWRKTLGPLGLGLGAGLVLLVILDAVWLGRPLFSVDVQSQMETVAFNAKVRRTFAEARGSYVDILLGRQLIAYTVLALLAVPAALRSMRAAGPLAAWSLTSLIVHGVLLIPGSHYVHARYTISILWPLMPLAGGYAVARAAGLRRLRPGAGRGLALAALAAGVIGVFALKYGVRIAFLRFVPMIALVCFAVLLVRRRWRAPWAGLAVVVLLVLAATSSVTRARLDHRSFGVVNRSWDRFLARVDRDAVQVVTLEDTRMSRIFPTKLSSLIGRRVDEDEFARIPDEGGLRPGQVLVTGRPREPVPGVRAIVEPENDVFGAVWAYVREAGDGD